MKKDKKNNLPGKKKGVTNPSDHMVSSANNVPSDKTQILEGLPSAGSEYNKVVKGGDSPNLSSSDRTVLSNDSASINPDDDKTRISSTPETEPRPANARSSSTPTSTAVDNQKPYKPSDIKKGFSGGELAAGMAGAGVAGVAIGATFGEDIKDALSDLKSTLGIDEPAHPIVDGEANVENPSFLSVAYTEADGTTYCVSMTDFDNDGSIDVTTGDIYFADGTSVEVVQRGDELSPLFMSGIDFAQSHDFTQSSTFIDLNSASFDSEIYHIQPGDTLSEIALDANSTVEEIMDANPQIHDPNLIYAGDELLLHSDSIDIPVGTNSSWEEGDRVETNDDLLPNSVSGTEANFDMGSGPDDYASTHDSQQFEQVNWDDFGGDAHTSSPEHDYSNLLGSTDFDSYHLPDSYTYDPSGDLGFSDFL